MRRPANGIYLLQSLAPPYQVWVMWRGRIIAGGFCRSHAAGLALARALQEQLAALPLIDQTGQHEEDEEERRAA